MPLSLRSDRDAFGRPNERCFRQRPLRLSRPITGTKRTLLVGGPYRIMTFYHDDRHIVGAAPLQHHVDQRLASHLRRVGTGRAQYLGVRDMRGQAVGVEHEHVARPRQAKLDVGGDFLLDRRSPA